MNLEGHDLGMLAAALRDNPALARKQDIQRVSRALQRASEGAGPSIRNGDDAAAIPCSDGYTLLAAEGMLPAFVRLEPRFAGFCALMTNVSDIAAMGGHPLAVVDVLFSGSDAEVTGAVLDGLAHAAETYAVPVVGGHTTRSEGELHLAAAVVGKARALITSFDARPGDVVLACIDLRGQFHAHGANFDAATEADPHALRAQLALLPRLAEAGLVHAGKDISMAGLVGTLLMLLESSGCGARLDLDAIPAPPAASQQPLRWLQAFPSYGFLLAVAPARAREVTRRFEELGVTAAVVAKLRAGHTLDLHHGGRSERFWDLAATPLVGFSPLTQENPGHA